MFLMINHIAPHSASKHNPLQAPMDIVDLFKDTIEDSRRRAYAGTILTICSIFNYNDLK